MKGTVGLGLAVAIGMAGMRAFQTPAVADAAPAMALVQGMARPDTQAEAKARGSRSGYRGGCTAYTVEAAPPATGMGTKAAKPGAAGAADSVGAPGAAKERIDAFFHLEGAATLKDRPGVRYAIALTPDPRRTNLSLVFDREMVAIQQAAQDEGYSYDASWLPWRTESAAHAESQHPAEGDAREACPGVLLFRRSVSDVKGGDGGQATPDHPARLQPAVPADPYAQGLVVLIVGEQPTGGLNEDQWANAITWLGSNVAAVAPSGPQGLGAAGTLSILGPSFSGSLVSLARNLAALPADGARFPSAQTPVRILSGGVSGCSSTRWFQQRMGEARAGPTIFGSFQENDELQIYRFLNYLKQQGGATADVAVLSEDETAYANSYTPGLEKAAAAAPKQGRPVAAACDFPYARSNRPVRLSYPRDISALRTAYEKQSVFSTGSGVRAIHPILQESADTEGDGVPASDTIRTFSGPMSPVAQEAVLYGIVSYLRAHRARYLLLRCTNPLDFLFLTRFFHRAYPEGRVVTVGSDLLFRREIDTTEFRGVMALSSTSLIPRNQHWGAVTQRPDDALASPHTHRTPESYVEATYLAGRYLFDPGVTLAVPADRQRPLQLPFKEDLPDFADPFWLHTPADAGKSIQAPTWLTVVGRDGYWPVAVLNAATTPDKRLDLEPGRDPHREPDHAAEDRQTPAALDALAPRPPPSTMVQVVSTSAHYDRTLDGRHFDQSLLMSAPLPWWLSLLCGFLLLLYQTVAVAQGSKHSSMGLYAPFRRLPTPSQGLLLGLNCAVALMLFQELFSIHSIVPVQGLATHGWLMNLPPTALVLGLVALYLPLVGGLCLRFKPIAATTFACVYVALAAVTSLVISRTISPGARSAPVGANAVPLFYRSGHLTSGVSPLVPVLFLLAGFYLWTWQALAGNALLCEGRPMLPRLRPRLPWRQTPAGKRVRLRIRRPLTLWIAFQRARRQFWDTLMGILPDRCLYPGTPLLERHYYRISHEIGKSILRVASPLSFPFTVVMVPVCLTLAAAVFLYNNGPQLLGLEGRAYAWVINLTLLFAFLLTIAEAARLYLTWVELRRLLTALNRLRLKRTFSRLRAVDVNSLWSVSGNVQRIQYLFLTQQMDAARRLSKMHGAGSLSIQRAIECGERFARNSASRLSTGPLWEKPVLRKGELPLIYMREVLNDAVADVLQTILIPHWADEEDSLSLENTSGSGADGERIVFDMKLCADPLMATAEEFVCFHYIAFIQNILARMRTMTLSMVCLFVSVCLSISFYPFVPRTGIAMWMMVNLALIASAVIYVYAGLERDETLSYITNTRPGRLGNAFYVKVAGFLAGPVIGLLTTQFPAISESVLGWLQPGLDALK